jgi:hypothetical protein
MTFLKIFNWWEQDKKREDSRFDNQISGVFDGFVEFDGSWCL